MKILIIGEEQNLKEFEAKFGASHQYSLVGEHREAEKFLETNDLTFDFIIDEEPDQFEMYTDKKVKVFLNSTKVSLAELSYMTGREMACTLFGFNGLPTFLSRSLFEVSLLHKEDENSLTQICESLNTAFVVVDDRVGMVTPRVISMIINEAYYAVQEGTATRDDIDRAMKLGTNYPYGPFEWTARIGLKHVYEVLEAIYEDTRDERYKICPLLKKEYLARA